MRDASRCRWQCSAGPQRRRPWSASQIPLVWTPQHVVHITKAYDDLRLWVMHSRFDSDIVRTKIYPEEMALLALNPDGASYLRKALSSAKLFSTGTWEFLVRDGRSGEPRPVKKGEDPEELNLDFVLFDRASDQFLQPGEDYRSGMMRLLTRSFSDMTATP